MSNNDEIRCFQDMKTKLIKLEHELIENRLNMEKDLIAKRIETEERYIRLITDLAIKINFIMMNASTDASTRQAEINNLFQQTMNNLPH